VERCEGRQTGRDRHKVFCSDEQLFMYIGYGDLLNTIILKYTISGVYLFGQHVSTLLLGHLQAVAVYTKVLWFTPTCWDPFGIVYI
jgi:hypothetical protein